MPASATLYPAPPPTNNTLDPEQRSRLLRSTRKLEAVLGTTPQFVDSDNANGNHGAVFDSTTKHNAHATKQSRSHLNITHPSQRGLQVYTSPSASSSVSSLDSLITPSTGVGAGAEDTDFVLVKGGPGARSAPYQVVPLPHYMTHSQSRSHSASRDTSPGSSRSASPANSIGSAGHRQVQILGKKTPHAQGLGVPMTVAVDIPLPSSERKNTKNKSKAGPQALAQPMLLRLRALPPDSRHSPSSSVSSVGSASSTSSAMSTQSSKSAASTLRTARPSIPAFSFPDSDSPYISSTSTSTQYPSSHSQSARATSTYADSVLGPLSPLIASLTLAGDDVPRSPKTPTTPKTPLHGRSVSMTVSSSTPQPQAQGMTDKERRRKMAKLQRTLGEQIPLELVFGSGSGSSGPNSAAPSTSASSRPKNRKEMSGPKGTGRMVRRVSLSAVPVALGGTNPGPGPGPSNSNSYSIRERTISRPLPIPPPLRSSSITSTSTPSAAGAGNTHKGSKSLAMTMFDGGLGLGLVSGLPSGLGGGVGSTYPVAQVPVPVPVPISVPSASGAGAFPSTSRYPGPQNSQDVQEKQTQTQAQTHKTRKPRPRSLTLGPTSAVVKADKRIAERQVQEASGRGFGTTSLDSGSRPMDRGGQGGGLGSAMPFGKLERAGLGLGLVPPFDTIGVGKVKEDKLSKSKSKERKAKKEDKPKKEQQQQEEEEEGYDGGFRRKEREWSGEWNVRDMDKVARQLRSLK